MQTNGNTIFECNVETRQNILRQINNDKFKKLLQTINGGNKVKLSFAPVIHSSSKITKKNCSRKLRELDN